MLSLDQLRAHVQKARTVSPEKAAAFFKTGPFQYAHHDRFLGVPTPALRSLAKKCRDLPLQEIHALLSSAFNEERALALFILAHQYKGQEAIYQFYLDHLEYVNNWNLVDISAHVILGAHLMDRNKEILVTLAHSKVLWERRIAIVATLWFIRHNELDWTFLLSKTLLHDSHDLIHKATGWMLREAGKRDEKRLCAFLDHHAQDMPRTMMRYAIERLPEEFRRTKIRV